MTNIIKAKILIGPFKGEDVLNRQIPIILTDMSFRFNRLQFPIRLASAITIKIAQGQSLELCGLYLHTDCFSYGQSYVACSRVGNPNNLFIYTETGTTKNIVNQQSIGKFNILETCIFFFFPFKQTQLQQRVAGYS